MDRITKAIRLLSPKEKKKFKSILQKINRGDVASLDLMKLKGYDTVYRVRMGDFRIIYSSDHRGIHLIGLYRRNDTTYNEI